jgi:Ca2+-binding RTX toxin-like protein
VNSNTTTVAYHLDKIEFADGTVWTWSETVGRKVIRGTEGNDTLKTSSVAGESVTAYGFGGNDTIYGGNGTDTLFGGEGSDTIFGGSNSDTIIGGPGNDVIYTRSSYEGGGKKVFIFHAGDGQDSVYYYNTAHKVGDGLGTLRFGAGIDPEDIEVSNSGANVVLALSDGSGKVTLVNSNTTTVAYHLDRIEFADGTVWTWSETVGRKVIRGTEGSDTLKTSSVAGESVTAYGFGGNDSISAGSGTDTLFGGEGRDTIFGGSNSDTIIGGPDNDTIYTRYNVEGGGKKVFIWNLGDGEDIVYYYNTAHKAGDGLGTLRFGTGINPEDIEVSNSGANVVLALSDGSGKVTLVNSNTTTVAYHLDRIEFADEYGALD